MEIIVTKEYIRKLQRDIDNTEVRLRIVDDSPSEAETPMEADAAQSQQPSQAI